MKVKNTIKLKNSLEGFNNRLDQVEEKISKFDRLAEFIPWSGKKRKNSKSRDSL